MKPIIAITAGVAENKRTGDPEGMVTLSRDYTRRVIDAGGAPVIVPPDCDTTALKDVIDGWLIPGGDDFDASLWGEETHPEANVGSQNRHLTEMDLYKAAPGDLPIFGICYGAQFVNIMQGGTLVQHLPDVLGHDNHRGDPIQDYKIDPESRTGQIFGKSARGKSWHHQAVGKIGHDLKAVAWHEDGTIEAIESTNGRWFVGLQWHPERTDLPESDLPFQAFIEAARKYRESKNKETQST